MKGSKVYSILKPLILMIMYVLRCLPYTVREVMFEMSSFIPTKLGVFLRLVLIKSLCVCGDNIYIATNVRIKNFKSLVLGNNVSIHENCFIDALGGISIGNNVSIAHNTSIVSFEHCWDNTEVPIKYNKLKVGEILISSDVWIGCGVRVLSGAEINCRSVVAAGSVVNKSYCSHSLIAGVPAKIIKGI
ncbi:acyltransferase [Vibrio alfacsensis]|uniref:acyltransferase n=1 Tax=Vibrio alfacsensis TaxID=1074311 RepID=UPI00406970A0